jgi:hypothetical protein
VRAERGASQILFGMLPTQTVDLEGGVWRVTNWADPVPLQLDPTAVRNALLEAISPWSARGTDAGVEAELRGRAPVQVVKVNEDRGVVVEPFPRQWRCRQCYRLTSEKPPRCRCGGTSFAQMQFVAYHTCGRIQEPTVRPCPAHRAVAVRLPGTATAREMYFFCPECHRKLSTGFPYQPCACTPGAAMGINVHRAAIVFSPHYAVLVNPPDPAAAARLRASGGGARALEWVLGGLGRVQPGEGAQTVEGLIEALIQQGISPGTARDLADRARERGEVTAGSAGGQVDLGIAVRERAQEEALSLASALSQGRVRIDDMIENTTPPLRTLYDTEYRAAVREAGLSSVELLTSFPVATLAFGFTRGGTDPGETTLAPFRDRGALRAYGTLTKTEALLFQLDPVFVHRYLECQGFELNPPSDAREARLGILRSIEVPRPTEDHPQELGKSVLTLLHSVSHRLIRTLAVTAGVERDGLAEYLLPHHFSLIIYASSRGQFVLGALQALFETRLDRLLDQFAHGEARCALDPGCRSGGGACMACLHLGEPSCRWFNRFLDRATLVGPTGFLTVASDA